MLRGMTARQVIEILRNRGRRITTMRASIVKIILESDTPIAAPTIQKILNRRGHDVNKTTVYREIAFLLREKIISEVRLAPHIIHYESAHLLHHHHMTCRHCGKTTDVKAKELEISMQKLENRLRKQGFAVKGHNLEFYGLCADCA
jgi:Fur family ferric uptake transcriptional regulator